MRIGFNTLYENPHRPTGSHDYNVRLIHEIGFGNFGHELLVFVSGAGEPHFRPTSATTQLVRCGASNDQLALRILSEQTLLPIAAARYRCDVLFAPGNSSPLLTHCPVVLNVKTMQHLVRPEGLSFLRSTYRSTMIGRSARHASLVIANSESNKRHIVDLLGVPDSKVRVVYEGLDHDLFHPHADPDRLRAELAVLGHRDPYVLFVSGLWPYKNVETLITAFGLAVNRGLPHHLLVAGGGDEDYGNALQALAAAGPAASRIHFLGPTTRIDVARLIQGADMLVLPSLYESFGRVVTEAMACGTPVIAAEATSLPEVVGDAGLLCSPEDAEAYADAMVDLASDHSLRAHLVARGLERAATFSWRRQAEMTVAVLEEAVA